MFDFTTSFMKIERLRAQAERAKKLATKKDAALQAEVEKLLAPLRPICLEAITIYNALGGTQLSSDAMKLAVDPKDSKIYMSMRVAGRYQPDDEWDLDDAKRINTRFKEVLDRRLREAFIPFSFGEMNFPPSYYMK